jgi:hypothetical protein
VLKNIGRKSHTWAPLNKCCTLGSSGIPSAASIISEVSTQHTKTDPETVHSSRSETDLQTIDSNLAETGSHTVELNKIGGKLTVKEQKELEFSDDEERSQESTTRSRGGETLLSDSNRGDEDMTVSSISSRRRGEPAVGIEELPLSLQRIQLRHWFSTLS